MHITSEQHPILRKEDAALLLEAGVPERRTAAVRAVRRFAVIQRLHGQPK